MHLISKDKILIIFTLMYIENLQNNKNKINTLYILYNTTQLKVIHYLIRNQ